MANAVDNFFRSWGNSPEAEALRHDLFGSALAEDCRYCDPRSDGHVVSPHNIAEYVGMFNNQTPGWTAEVVEYEERQPHARAKVKFSGPDAEGKMLEQHGVYFVDMNEDGKLTQIVGFADDE